MLIKVLFTYLLKMNELNERVQTSQFNQTCRQDHPSSHHGGGLITLVKEVLLYQRIADDYHPLEKKLVQIRMSRRWWESIHNRSAHLCPDTLVLAIPEPEKFFFAVNCEQEEL